MRVWVSTNIRVKPKSSNRTFRYIIVDYERDSNHDKLAWMERYWARQPRVVGLLILPSPLWNIPSIVRIYQMKNEMKRVNNNNIFLSKPTAAATQRRRVKSKINLFLLRNLLLTLPDLFTLWLEITSTNCLSPKSKNHVAMSLLCFQMNLTQSLAQHGRACLTWLAQFRHLSELCRASNRKGMKEKWGKWRNNNKKKNAFLLHLTSSLRQWEDWIREE